MNLAAAALLLAVLAAAVVTAARTITKRGAGDLPASVSDEKVCIKNRKHPLAGRKTPTTEPREPERRQTLEDTDWDTPLEDVKARFRSLVTPCDCPEHAGA